MEAADAVDCWRAKFLQAPEQPGNESVSASMGAMAMGVSGAGPMASTALMGTMGSGALMGSMGSGAFMGTMGQGSLMGTMGQGSLMGMQEPQFESFTMRIAREQKLREHELEKERWRHELSLITEVIPYVIQVQLDNPRNLMNGIERNL